ncbi:hypothetical protein GQ457_03G025840 [Hibiscus cannabinus]
MERKESIDTCRWLGYTVFVDNVSKMINHLTLKEDFTIYGTVMDVFVAQRNPKRRAKSTTFAFVRFKNREEASRAVENGYGRVMDGYRIKGYDEKKKVKVWVTIQDIPPSVEPNVFFFTTIGRKWGSVLKIDDNTLNRNRFDKARMLVAVQKVSHIPARNVILFNGRCQEIRLRMEEYDGDLRFIDVQSPFEEHEESGSDALIEEPCINVKEGERQLSEECQSRKVGRHGYNEVMQSGRHGRFDRFY